MPALAGARRPSVGAASGPRDEEEVPSDLTPALALRSATKMVPPPSKSEVPRPVFLSARRMSGTTDREAVAEGDAELRKVGTVAEADRMTYWPIDDEMEAVGNVRLTQGEDVITGPKMRLKLEEQVGFFEQPNFFLKREFDPAKSGGEGGEGQVRRRAGRRNTVAARMSRPDPGSLMNVLGVSSAAAQDDCR